MPLKKGKKTQSKRKIKVESSRELVLKDNDAQEYAQIVRPLGNSRFELLCFDGKTRLGHVRGKMRRRAKVGTGDFVLVSLRDYQDDKADIIWTYSLLEAKELQARGELPETADIKESALDDEASGDDAEIMFDQI